MIVGDIKKINLSVSSFERMITSGNLCVDKTRLIEHFLDEALAQIDQKRYGSDIDNGKRLIKVGVAFCGKLCRVKCSS